LTHTLQDIIDNSQPSWWHIYSQKLFDFIGAHDFQLQNRTSQPARLCFVKWSEAEFVNTLKIKYAVNKELTKPIHKKIELKNLLPFRIAKQSQTPKKTNL
jgi:hypothetical protein